MHEVLHLNGIGSFSGDYYWSSSEKSDRALVAWFQYISSGYQAGNGRNCDFYVRPCRAF